MIELKSVGKVYKAKKSIDTVALYDVSLKFQNNGMVFIVGKSGSGKSTLLNIIGGLDSVTSGDVLIEGKNLNNFKTSELDSYRNTYVGFIFQEFNILEQFSVSENIELSLRLQGREQNKDRVLEILDNLDLNGLENRRINELSGGQKQRVSIGRALIKNPKLILADEPTGNLDLKSGKQVFDILKNISREHLVVVVSHDMESAKMYADRIIEIQEGKVIRDTNVSESDLNNELTFKESKLPFSYAFKMALNSFKYKPLRLLMTIFLTAISLVFLGVSFTLQLFDKNSLIINTMKDNEVQVFDLEKVGLMEDNLVLEEEDIDYFKNLVDNEINLVYEMYSDAIPLNFEFGENESNDVNTFYGNRINEIKVVDVKDSRIMGKLIGREMENSEEIVIHKYLADYIIKYGIKGQDSIVKPKDYSELIESNDYIKLGYNYVKVVGIVDDEDSIYKEAKDKDFFEDDNLYSYFQDNYVSKGSYIYTKDFVDSAVLVDSIEEAYFNSVYVFGNDMSFDNLKVTSDEVHIVEGGNGAIRKLEGDEIVLSKNAFINSSPFKDGLYEYLEDNENMIFKEAKLLYSSIYFRSNIVSKSVIIQNKFNGDKYVLSVAGLVDSDYSYISSEFLDSFIPRQKEVKSIRVYEEDVSKLDKIFNTLKLKSDVSNSEQYVVSIEHEEEIRYVILFYKNAKLFIICISLVFMIFAFMLFSNFIGVSITYSKKEIGVLRALGARSRDVFKIFGLESLIIAFLATVLGVIGWLVVCTILNHYIFGKFNFNFNGVIVNPIVPFILILFMVFLALIVTLGFVSRISKIKPIDAILNK